MSSPAHVLRVQRLYRSSLKCLANWTVHRDLWIKKGFELRAEFDANKSVTNPHLIEKLLSDGEAKLAENAHPDPYTVPTDPGGTKYMRYVNNGLGYSPEVIAIPSYFK